MTKRRLAPRELPTVVQWRDPVIKPSPRKVDPVTPTQPAKPAVEIAAFSAVPAARVLEIEVFEFLQKTLAAKDGRAALSAVDPGTTLAERLQYCLCRIQLGLPTKVIPELERLTRDHPNNPTVWRILGIGYRQVAKTGEEINAYRRCYDLDSPEHLVCPNVIRVLGTTMLDSPAHGDGAVAFLREELAKGPEFEWAARRLAILLSSQERHGEGLFCLEAGLLRNPRSALLRYSKGAILFDLHRLDAAKAVLEPLLDNEVVGKYAKEYLLRTHLLSGEIGRAKTLCQELQALEGLDDQHRELYRNLSNQLNRGDLGVVDCYAILRGHKSMKVRLGVLGKLARNEKSPAVASRALLIAANSGEALMRIQALRLLVSLSGQPLVDLQGGFRDTDSKVRAMAATVAAGLAGQDSRHKSALVTMVLETLAVEKDPYAFRSLHQAMQELTGAIIEIPFGGAKDPEQRRRLLKAWRDRK